MAVQYDNTSLKAKHVNAMYKEYHALGGNGTVTALVNTIHELEVRDDKRPASQA